MIGVLATSATFQGELYASVVDRHAAGVEVVEQVGRGLVELVEARRVDDPAVEAGVAAHLAPLVDAGVDTLVLGCTHYSFLAGIMRRHLGAAVTVIDPAPAVARQVVRVLDEGDLRAPPGDGGVVYLTSGDPIRLADQVERLLGDPYSDTGRFEIL